MNAEEFTKFRNAQYEKECAHFNERSQEYSVTFEDSIQPLGTPIDLWFLNSIGVSL